MCVRIIISQKNATLQTAIVMKSSIFDLGKAPQIQLWFAYILNKKTAVTSKENKAHVKLLRQHPKRVTIRKFRVKYDCRYVTKFNFGLF